MIRSAHVRCGLIVALGISFSPFLLVAADKANTIKTSYYKGKVVPLATVLEKFGAKLDADASPQWLALITDEGRVYPLIKDDGSRMFFKDPQLLNRPMRLGGRLLPETHLLQVVEVHSYVKGQLHEAYYWCDVCSIRRSEKMICECCGGPMDFREEPVKR